MEKYIIGLKTELDRFIGMDVPIKDIQKIASTATLQQYDANEYFLRYGEWSRRIGYVTTGLLRLFYIDKVGKEYTKNFKSVGQFAASQAALLLNAPSKLCIQAIERSEIISFAYDDILQLANQKFEWQLLLRKSAEADYLEKEKRESDLLYYDAKERYHHFVEEHPDWNERIQQRYIASYLGISAETLSRIRKNL